MRSILPEVGDNGLPTGDNPSQYHPHEIPANQHVISDAVDAGGTLHDSSRDTLGDPRICASWHTAADLTIHGPSKPPEMLSKSTCYPSWSYPTRLLSRP